MFCDKENYSGVLAESDRKLRGVTSLGIHDVTWELSGKPWESKAKAKASRHGTLSSRSLSHSFLHAGRLEGDYCHDDAWISLSINTADCIPSNTIWSS